MIWGSGAFDVLVKGTRYTYSVFTLPPQVSESFSVVTDFAPKGFDALVGFLLFGLYELLFGQLGIVVYCPGEGVEGGGYLAYSKRLLVVPDAEVDEAETDLAKQGKCWATLRKHRGLGGRRRTA